MYIYTRNRIIIMANKGGKSRRGVFRVYRGTLGERIPARREKKKKKTIVEEKYDWNRRIYAAVII